MKPGKNIFVLTSMALAMQLAIHPTTASAQGMMLEEIIVTAQRREQSLQDVPLSVSALTADSLRDGGVMDASRLKILVPGMNFGQTGSYAHLAIRGARTESVQMNSQPIISSYIDGIYRSGTEQFLGPMIDLERVEVLRGPQGTTYGRNSYGGAIALHTNNPTSEGFDASVKITGGDYSRTDFQGWVNLPITDSISARVAGAHLAHDGYVENQFPGGDDIDDQDEDYIRGALLFEFDRGSLILRGEYNEKGGAGSGDFAGSLAGSINAVGNGTPGTGLYASPGRIGGDVFGVAEPFNTSSGCGSYGSNFTAPPFVAGPSLLDANGDCPLAASIANDPYQILTDAPYILRADQKTYSAELNWDFGFTNMMLMLAHTESVNYRSNDGDQGPSATFVTGEIITTDTNQVEVHFTDNGEGDLSWLAGVFYLHDEKHDNFFFNSGPNGFQFTCITSRDSKNSSWALFGQATYPVLDTTRLTVGARVSEEENEWVVNEASVFTYFSTVIPSDHREIDLDNGTFSINANATRDREFGDTFEPVVWRVALDHDLSENSLIYASVATGYQSGGFNSVPDPANNKLTYPENEMIAYEVGFKGTLLDGAMTLNAAFYYNDFKDVTAEKATVLPSGSIIVFSARGGDGEAKGIDLEMDWIPAENWLVNVRGSWMDAKFNNFITGLGGFLTTAGDRLNIKPSQIPADLATGGTFFEVVRDGEQMPYSPDFTLGITASYVHALGGGMGTLVPLVQFYYSDDYQTSDQGYLLGVQDSYAQADLRLTWISEGGHFNISAFVQNVGDEAVLARTNIFGATLVTQQIGPPRIWGISIGFDYQ